MSTNVRASDSIWRDAIDVDLARHPGGSIDADVAVIGSGLGGLSAALHLLLTRPGRSVVVLEASQLGHGASSRSAGMLTPGVGQNLPGIIRRAGKASAKAMYEATLHAVEYAGELTREQDIDCQLRMSGQLAIAHGRSGRHRLAVVAAALGQLGLPHETMNDAQLSETLRLAVVAGGRGPAALRLPIAGVLNPGLLVSGLARAVMRRGGRLYSGARVLAIGRGRPVHLPIAGGGEVRARDVVVATSAYSESLGVQRGRVIPVHLRVLLTAPLDDRQLDRLGWAGREGVIDSRRIFNYFRLTEDRRVLFGGGVPIYRKGGATDEHGSRDVFDPLRGELAATFGEDLGLRVERAWSGPIGYVLDTLPVIQRLHTHPSVVFVGGWCGHGIALSLRSGKWVADIIDGAAAPADLPWFRAAAPLVPFEPVRRIAVPACSWGMSLLDRL
ncbi:MAG: FAD-dependent oxidoreductase [Luteitalea sp.]|nr:FAD-dependent oxidoreductase [Luteitalea sp.]